jgi:phosphatidate cytidylyltransferase
MKRVLTALILIPVVLALVFLGPKWLITLAVAAVAMMAGWEFLGLAERCGAKPGRIAVIVAIMALFGGNFEWPDQTLIILGALSLGLLVYCTFGSPVERVLLDATSSIFALYYVGLTLIAVPTLREQPNGPTLVVFLLCVVWSGDIAALYVGRMWGRHKLAPTLSPNKTWEGSVGSVAWYWLVMAAAVNIAAQVGDLAESALKRSAGVKDSGALLPGHGGCWTASTPCCWPLRCCGTLRLFARVLKT